MNTHEQKNSMPLGSVHFAHVCSHEPPVDDVDASRSPGRYSQIFLASVHSSGRKLCEHVRVLSRAHSLAYGGGHLASGALSSQTFLVRCRAPLYRLFLYRTIGQMGHCTHLCPPDCRTVCHVAVHGRDCSPACRRHYPAYMERCGTPGHLFGDSPYALQWKWPVLSGDSSHKSCSCIDPRDYSLLVIGRAALHQNDPLNHASKKSFSKALARHTLAGRQLALTRFFSGASQSPFFFPLHHQWRDCVARMEARTQVVAGGAA